VVVSALPLSPVFLLFQSDATSLHRNDAACLEPQPNHPERMKVNSRGRAALREAHGSNEVGIEDPERVEQSRASILSGSDHMIG